VRERDFLWGFLENEDVIGRPVDVAQGADGAIYVSDDYAGSVYRIAAGGGADLAPLAASGASPAASVAADPRVIARGRALFASNECARCHDPASPVPGMVVKPLTGLASRYSQADLERYLAAPQPPMPLFPLSPAERRDLAAFLLAR
jgi:mono/diheme cytochrome c family protein